MKCPKVRGSWIGLCACLLLTLGQSAHADSWVRAESRHFRVYSNISAAQTRQHIERLEAFKYLGELILGTDPKDTAAGAKFTIYLFAESDLIKTVRPNSGRGVAVRYIHCVENAQAFLLVPQWFGYETNYELQFLLHEYGHHLMFSRQRRFYPSWYVEGFADYLSTTTLDQSSFHLGVRDIGRVNAPQSEDWLDFGIMLDPKRFAAAAKKDQVNPHQFYPQSWLLAHYMLADSARTQAFNNYFDQIGRGEDGVDSFKSATGMTPAQLRTELVSYQRKYSSVLVKVPDLPDIDITVTQLPKEQGDYLIEAATLQTCPKESYGRKLTEQFRAMRKKRTLDVRLRVELSRAELLFGDPKAAKAELESLFASDAIAFDVAYLLGRIYYNESKQGTEEQQLLLRNQASEQFLKAYALDKTNAPNLYFLSMSLDDEGAPSKAVVNAGTAAAILAPSVAEYAVHAALVNLRNDNRATAIRVLQPFANNPHELKYAAQVSALINSIRENEEITEMIARLEKLGVPPKEKEEDD